MALSFEYSRSFSPLPLHSSSHYPPFLRAPMVVFPTKKRRMASQSSPYMRTANFRFISQVLLSINTSRGSSVLTTWRTPYLWSQLRGNLCYTSREKHARLLWLRRFSRLSRFDTSQSPDKHGPNLKPSLPPETTYKTLNSHVVCRNRSFYRIQASCPSDTPQTCSIVVQSFAHNLWWMTRHSDHHDSPSDWLQLDIWLDVWSSWYPEVV